MSAHGRRGALAVVAIVIAAAAHAGCILVSDFSGLSGGVREGGAPEDGSGASEDASDSSMIDAGTDAVDAAPAFTCDGSLFCDSFDTGAIAPPWTRATTSAGAVARINPLATALTAPNALFTSVVAGQGTPNPFAYVARDFLPAPQTFATAKLSFAIYPERLDPAGGACVAGFVFGQGTANQRVLRLTVGREKSLLEERSSANTRFLELVSSPPLKQWSRMSIAVLPGDRVGVELDGKSILETTALFPWLTSDAFRIFVGINFATDETVEGFAFNFDDVRFEGAP